jgi:outer membrane protein OmpA-like peptidoglycan-associated protein
MRKKSGTYLICITILSMVAGCSMTPQQTQYTAAGAAGGALVGGGIGCGIAASIDRDDPTSYAIGCPIGVGAGALIGAVIGYFMAPGPTPPVPPAPLASPMPPSPPPPPAQEQIILRGVHFDFDKAIIRDVDKPVLDEAAAKLKASPSTRIHVNGYTDAIGSEAYNLKLSQRRADAVAAFFENQGIPSGQLVPQGFGKTHFVATNATDDGRAQNRRVELVPEAQ